MCLRWGDEVENNMNETTHNLLPAPADSLHAELRALIASSRHRLAGAVNAELTRLYWSVGQRLRTEVLDGADRAKYGDQLISRVGDQLAQEFGPDLPAARDCRDTATTIELEPFCKPAAVQNQTCPPVLRQPGEEAPIGLILCAESSREQVELLQMHKDGITVAEYWTELPPKAELEQKLHAALLEARERLARRGVLLGDLDDE
jgi:DUF1016 N-terminal domain